MQTRIHKILICTAATMLLALPMLSAAELTVQNAQYDANKHALFVKGKLSGDGVVRVYVIDVDRNLQIGTIDTYSRGQQFKADLPIATPERAPCVIKVQTAPAWGGKGFFGAFGFAQGEYTVASVRNSADRCNATE